MRKLLQVVGGAVLLAFIAAAGAFWYFAPRTGELPPRTTEIGRLASHCSKPLYCGAVGFVDCNSALDGPAFYFRKRNGQVISACGGVCMANDCPPGTCPPSTWRCTKPSVLPG